MKPSADTSLTAELKQATAEAHRRVEKNRLVQKILAGSISDQLLRKYLTALLPVYNHLESALSQLAEGSRFSGLYDERLCRYRAIVNDLGNIDEKNISENSLSQWVQRAIKENEFSLVAICYVRYLGDLNGGQILLRSIEKSDAISSETGLSFFRFESIPDMKEFISAYRSKINRLELTAAGRRQVIACAVEFFNRHDDLFNQISV